MMHEPIIKRWRRVIYLGSEYDVDQTDHWRRTKYSSSSDWNRWMALDCLDNPEFELVLARTIPVWEAGKIESTKKPTNRWEDLIDEL